MYIYFNILLMVEEIDLDESRKKQLKHVLKTDPDIRT